MCVILFLFFGINESTSSVLEENNAFALIFVFILLVLAFFPLYNTMILGRPTSDATTDLDKMLETKVLDKFQKGNPYGMAFLLYLVLYFIPPVIIYFVINNLYDLGFVEALFLWFLFVPLLFLNYFTASGVVAGIIATSYSREHHVDPREERYLITGKPNPISRTIKSIMMIIAWAPFLSAVFGMFSKISKILSGSAPEEIGFLDVILIGVTMAFGILGFFKKFWNKKSKTKSIDFLFSGWIFIALGANLLITFSAAKQISITNTLDSLNLHGLAELFENPALLLPIILIQYIMIVFYGGSLLVKTNSIFYGDLRLHAIIKASGMADIEKIQKMRKKGKTESGTMVKDIDLLIKSSLLIPIYDKKGIDINGEVRSKAAQFLYLACVDDKEKAEKVINAIFINTLEQEKEANISLLAKIFALMENILIKLKIKMDLKNIFLSKEAVDFLGYIGKIYPDLVLNRLLVNLDKNDALMQNYILDAIGDIGESKENIGQVLEKIHPLLMSSSYEKNKSTYNAIVEMVVEGDYNDDEFVQMILKELFCSKRSIHESM